VELSTSQLTSEALTLGRFSELGSVFGDNTAAAANIDRLVHHAKINLLKGTSYRTRGKEQTVASTATPTQETA